jgi:iron(II)-dependent oxidoreductase
VLWNLVKHLARSKQLAALAAAAAGLAGVVLGWMAGSAWLPFVCGVIALSSGGFFLGLRRAARNGPSLRSEVAAAVAVTAGGAETGDLVEDMLRDGRHALLLRPQILSHLTADQRRRATEAQAAEMATVPAGEVLLGVAGEDLDEGRDDPNDPAARGALVEVDEFYLDRRPVTNREYLRFVAAGGYEQMAIWDPQIWPAVADFVDRSGKPGPRFWKNGCYESGQDDHPLVGVSWYEAAAYARWVGKRLPTSAEWEKAASSPVQLPDAAPLQRRFPWGESMQRSRANLWGAGPGRTVPVDDYREGTNASDIRQLIGNVWEWTLDDFREPGLVLPAPMKVIRGAAYDTYFESQATCQFASGEVPVSRKHNIGIRCALGACDFRPPSAPSRTEEHAAPAELVLADEPALDSEVALA